MTRDATLDAFGTSQETDDDPDGPNDRGEPDEPNKSSESNETIESEETAGDGVQAVEVTTDWTPAGATCAACGATVERRWQHEGSLVCPDCKDWRER